MIDKNKMHSIYMVNEKKYENVAVATTNKYTQIHTHTHPQL